MVYTDHYEHVHALGLVMCRYIIQREKEREKERERERERDG
jgi:hypothetical protein